MKIHEAWLVEWKSDSGKTVGHLADLVAQGSEVSHGLDSRGADDRQRLLLTINPLEGDLVASH